MKEGGGVNWDTLGAKLGAELGAELGVELGAEPRPMMTSGDAQAWLVMSHCTAFLSQRVKVTMHILLRTVMVLSRL